MEGRLRGAFSSGKGGVGEGLGGGIRRETRGKRAHRGLGTRAGALFLHIEKCPKCLIASSHTVVSRPLALRRKSSGADQKLVQYVRQIGAFEASRPFFQNFDVGVWGMNITLCLGPRAQGMP